MDWHGITPADFDDLARSYGTPYFLYDADLIARRVHELREALEGQVSVYYAVKANPNLELLRAVSSAVDGVDISSAGELDQALLAGFDAADISFAGPAKSEAEIEAAIRGGVGCISLESVREIEECVKVARQLGKRAKILLRINPVTGSKAYGLKMGGRPVQFGIDEEAIEQAISLVSTEERYLEFRGIHVYAGSQCFEPSGVLEVTRTTLRIARDLEARSGLRCEKLNLGGGFGVSHGEGGREFDYRELASGLVPLLRAYRGETGFDCEFIFELGRYLTAVAGIYVTRVISSKMSRGKAFFACDGGLNHHLAAAGTFGAVLRTNYELCNLSHPDEAAIVCNVVGPSCNPTDLLGVDASLPRPSEGDLLGVLRSGSYGFTASPLLFLGRPTAVELVRRNGEIVLGRRSRTMTEFN